MLLPALWLLSGATAVNSLQTRAEKGLTHRTRTFRTIVLPPKHIEAPRASISSLPESLSLGTLLAYEPSNPVNDELFLFLAGTGNACAFYSQLLEAIGGSMRALCMPYDNRETVVSQCGFDRNCYARLRKDAIDGSFGRVAGNNIEGRLVSALQYLSRTGSPSWARYLEGEAGPPRWRAVRVAGHSQGAGDAAMLGYLREVARVVQFSGVCDLSDWTRRLGPGATPPDRFFGFGSAHDVANCGLGPATQVRAWRAEGALGQAAQPLQLARKEDISSNFLGGAQTVVTHIQVPDCQGKRTKECNLKAHESTAANTFAPELSPYAGGIWQALVGI